jgi:sarcosine oxidase
MNNTTDVIVIGLGAHGSATAYQLARLGVRAIGIDRLAPPHSLGSSHGSSRITRLAVGEGAQFVPLVKRSHQLWRELEERTGRPLYLRCGGLVMRSPGGASLVRHHGQVDFVQQTIDVARRFEIKHELLNAAEIQARFPQFVLRGDETGYFEPEAGVLNPEACVEAQLAQACVHGAELHTDETVRVIDQKGASVTVITDRGRYQAAKAVVCAGAWTARLFGPPWNSLLTVSRQTLHWFRTEEPSRYAPGVFPIYIWIHGAGEDDAMYGFPLLDDAAGRQNGIKVGSARYSEPIDPDLVDRTVAESESRLVYEHHVHGRLRGVTSDQVASTVCLYTIAPGSNFIVDQHPAMPMVTVVSACSGHGFKHSAALGEAVAQRIVAGRSSIDLSDFALDCLTN